MNLSGQIWFDRSNAKVGQKITSGPIAEVLNFLAGLSIYTINPQSHHSHHKSTTKGSILSNEPYSIDIYIMFPVLQ